MARFDQYIGLNEWATREVRKREKALITGTMEFQDGRRRRFRRWAKVPVVKSTRVIGAIRGAYVSRVADLKEYTMPDGRVLQEFVQAAPWCGGPNYFIALKDVKTGLPVQESLWTDDEMI